MKPLVVCRFLNNKAYFFPPSLDREADARAPATPFWCARTCDPVGPDGNDVRDDRCLDGRPCFEPQVRF